MQFVEKRVYAGSPNELATVDTTEQNGGAVTVRLDGAVVAEDIQFPLASVPGGERRVEISLVGAKGAFCVVGVSPVDGAHGPRSPALHGFQSCARPCVPVPDAPRRRDGRLFARAGGAAPDRPAAPFPTEVDGQRYGEAEAEGRTAMTRLLLALAILSTVVPRAASGQAITIDTVKKDIVQEGVMAARLNSPATPVRRPFSGTVDASASYGSLVTLVVLQGVQKKQAYKTLVDLMAVRVDTQLGSPSQSSGSTSLATKGAVPAILGFAVEHGALTRDVNGTVVTFRASPAGLVKALQGEGLLDMYRDYEQSAGFRFASRFSLAASFDTSRGETPNSLLANEQQLSAWSVRVVAYDTRDPRGRKYHDFWTTLAHEQGAALQDVRQRLVDAFGRWPGFTTWQAAFTSRVIAEVDGPWESSARGDAATQRAAATMIRHPRRGAARSWRRSACLPRMSPRRSTPTSRTSRRSSRSATISMRTR